MSYNIKIKEVLEFVEENDVKFIRLAFCDILGIPKNISIMPRNLKERLNKVYPLMRLQFWDL